MSEKIINIEERMLHKTGPALCSACGKTWIFTAPVETNLLECPSCGKMEGGEIKSRYTIGFWDGCVSAHENARSIIAKCRWFPGKKKLLNKIKEESLQHHAKSIKELDKYDN